MRAAHFSHFNDTFKLKRSMNEIISLSDEICYYPFASKNPKRNPSSLLALLDCNDDDNNT